MYMLKLIASKVPHTQQVYDVQPFEIMKAEWMHAPRVIMMFQPATRSILVELNQHVFTKKRCIHDNFTMVPWTARYLHMPNEPHLMLKLDICTP